MRFHWDRRPARCAREVENRNTVLPQDFEDQEYHTGVTSNAMPAGGRFGGDKHSCLSQLTVGASFSLSWPAGVPANTRN